MPFEFVPATKAGCKARIALIGGPGSGKTWTALTIAQGLDRGNGEVGVLDTDRQSARKYAHEFRFRWLGMTAYNPEDLTRAVVAATDQNIGVLIIDTWSPFWGGQDGMLDKVGAFQTSFEGWRHMRPVERQMVDALFGFPGHVIVNLRTKVEYVVETNDKGKAEPRRIGLKPEQREGVEYEFDVVGDIDQAGASLRISKTRCPELADKVYSKPGAEVGDVIQAWLDRDAIGEPLNPNTVREWAFQPERTIEELRDKHQALEAVGQVDAVVYDAAGEKLVAVGALLMNRARDIRMETERLARASGNGRTG